MTSPTQDSESQLNEDLQLIFKLDHASKAIDFSIVDVVVLLPKDRFKTLAIHAMKFMNQADQMRLMIQPGAEMTIQGVRVRCL